MALTAEEKRERDAAYQRRKRIMKKYLDEGCQRNLVYRPETVRKLACLVEMIGLDDNEVNQVAVEVLFDLLTGTLGSSDSDESHETSLSTKSDAHILLLRKKNIYTGDPALAKDLEEGGDASLALTPYTASNLSVQKILAKQGQAKRRDEGKDIDPTLIETATTIAGELLAMIRREMPDFKSGVPIDLAKWRGPIIDMLDRDGRDPKEISAIIDWIGKHSDWDVRAVLGPKAFRKQFDRLAISYRQWCEKRAQLEDKAAKKAQRKGKANKKDVCKREGACPSKLADSEFIKAQMDLADREWLIELQQASLTANQAALPVASGAPEKGSCEGGNDVQSDSMATAANPKQVGMANSIMMEIRRRVVRQAEVAESA